MENGERKRKKSWNELKGQIFQRFDKRFNFPYSKWRTLLRTKCNDLRGKKAWQSITWGNSMNEAHFFHFCIALFWKFDLFSIFLHENCVHVLYSTGSYPAVVWRALDIMEEKHFMNVHFMTKRSASLTSISLWTFMHSNFPIYLF